ncbi:hypothetical protein L1049_027422 [Liquidambar formosana]|uniref:F-box domain-containing protein n=1 Tax=Liquidambar formosana TaxID=63359 RepID=A0AAP0RJ00_LIQFO
MIVIFTIHLSRFVSKDHRVRAQMADLNEKMISCRGFCLPADIISDILSRLPVGSILSCRSVCKTWYSLSQGPQFVKLQLSRANDQVPRVILQPISVKAGTISSLYLLDIEGHKARVISEIPLEDVGARGIRIMCSCNGLLCMASGLELNPVVIYNPVTKEYIVLPKSEQNFGLWGHQVGFGFNPVIKKYKVVRIYETYTNGNIHNNRGDIITLGESSWRQIHVPYRLLYTGCHGPIFCGGALHWIINREFHNGLEFILRFHISKEVFQGILLPTSAKAPKYEPVYFTCNLQLLNVGRVVTLVDHDGQAMHVWALMGNKSGDHIFCTYNSFKMKLTKDSCCFMHVNVRYT